MNVVLNVDGITLFKDLDKYYIQYDGGMFTVELKRLLITKDEAESIIDNPDVAEQIVIQYQNKGQFGEDVS